MKPKLERPSRCRIFTFYSYKGGVGRTMALANVACRLAVHHGKRVICVDWDLEAPGLHFYFGFSDSELASRAGLLDYLFDFRLEVRRGAAGVVPALAHYLVPLKDDVRERITAGSVKLLHCGRTNASYMLRVQEFDWPEFYSKDEGYRIIQTLRKQLLDEADIVLVDARAGQADVGVTPTVQLPDAVVLLFAADAQSLEGSQMIATRLAAHPDRVDQDVGPPHVILVPARVFPEEETYQRWIDEDVMPAYEALVKKGIIAPADSSKDLLRQGIPVEPKFATRESLPVLDRSPFGSRLKRAYANLAQALDNMYQGHDAPVSACPTVRQDPPS